MEREDIQGLSLLWGSLKLAINSTSIEDIKFIHWIEKPDSNVFYIVTGNVPDVLKGKL